MFGLGLPEMMVIAVIALIIFGPKKLPEMGKSLGTMLREFKKGAESMTEEVKSVADVSDLTKEFTETTKELKDVGKTVTNPLDSLKDTDKSDTDKKDTDKSEAEKVVSSAPKKS